MMTTSYRIALFICVSALVLTPSIASAQATLINFDWDSSGNAITSGSKLTFEYSTLGLTFFHTGPTAGSCDTVRASDVRPAGFGSSPNVITLCPSSTWSDISENTFGLIRMTSRFELSSVCIDVRPNGGTGKGVMRAYDGGGALIQESVSTAGVTETLCTSGRRIRAVEFSGHGDKFAFFDNLGIAGPGLGPVYHFVPGAADISGANDTAWHTTLEIHNPGPFDTQVTIALLPRDQANPTFDELNVIIPANSSRRFLNMLAWFRFHGAATLRVAAFGTVHVTARTYNQTPQGTYGQFVLGKTIDEAIGPGRQGRMIQLSQSDDDTTGQRTNIGLVNAEDFTIVVMMALYDGDGTLLGQFPTTLQPLMSVQYDKVFRIFTSAEVEDGYAVVWSDTPEAVFFAFATPIDNRTGDGFYFPAIVE